MKWRYHAGNSWNKDPHTGETCLGCGPQEEFYGCADITITGDLPPSEQQQTVTVNDSLEESFELSIVTETPLKTVKTKPTTTTTIKRTTTRTTSPITKELITIPNDIKQTYRYSKKVIYNPIANRIEIILYKNNSQQQTKKIEIIPEVNFATKRTKNLPEIHFVTNRPTTSSTTTTTTVKQTIVSSTIEKAIQKKSNEELCFNGDGHYADLNTQCKEYYVCVFAGTPVVKVIRLRCPGSNISMFIFINNLN